MDRRSCHLKVSSDWRVYGRLFVSSNFFDGIFRFDTGNHSINHSNICLTIRLTIRFDDLDSMSDDLEQSLDDLDYTSLYFHNPDLTSNDLELSIEYLVSETKGLRPARPSQFATASSNDRLGLFI